MSPAKHTIPFPSALADADINVKGLNSILDDALIVGNGDINAVVWTEQGALILMLTKNDVWDARLDTSNDPPLPTLARIKELARSGAPITDPILPRGMTWTGKDSYHSHAYPCPRACARVRLGAPSTKPAWRCIRAEGQENAWERRGEITAMSIKGRKGASNGYAYGPLDLATDSHTQLHLRLSGTDNARYFVDVMGPDNRVILGSGWMDSPTQTVERTFKLPAGKKVAQLILYTWTKDGQNAENRFEAVTFEGPAGRVAVDLKVSPSPTCSGRLDLRRAVAYVHGARDGPPPAQIRALADRNVFLIESPAPAELVTIESGDIPVAERGESDGVKWLRQTIPGDLDWPGMSFAVALAAGGERKAIAIVTSRESKDVVTDAVALARSALQNEQSELIKSHERVWEEFWSRSGIEIADPLLQRTWYRSLYFLRCVSKPGVICPGLFASLVNDHPAWHGDYHTNYNIQQTFWGAYAANHPELAEPYDRLISEYLPRAKWLVQQVFSMQGAYYPHVLFAYEPPNPAECKSRNGRQYIHHTWGMTLGVNGFTVQPLWWHYKYAPEHDFLEKTAYPAVREVALFYAEFIEQCDGNEKIVLAPSVSPEHWGWTKGLERNRNCAFDIAMVRYILEAAIAGAKTLARDETLVARFEKALERLPPYPTSEGIDQVVVDVEGAPSITYNISVPATPVFPCDVVTWQSPKEERDLFTRTIEQLKWNGNNATVMLAVARARLSMTGAQEWLRNEVEQRTRPNGTMSLNRLRPHYNFNDFGHYSEQFGVGLAISELLVQSVADVIRIFPALTPGCKAACENLRTQGGFLVSAKGRGESVDSLTITSTVGGPLRLLSPWPSLAVRRDERGEYEPLTLDERGLIELQTKPGETLEFRPRIPEAPGR